jgi:long-chain acyl-CoA synthetase
MLGYYKNQERTREVLTEDGWFKTGDLGVFDNDGWLSHKGRLKNMIVGSNGENIYPEEIESVINNFRHVVESIVVEKKGKLVAMVHFNREELEQKVRDMRADFSQKVDDKFEELSNKVDVVIEELSRELQHYVNTRVNKVSRIQMLIPYPEPFQKTATKKIKRYLYF